MMESLETGPSIRQQGSKIPGDPASVVMEQGNTGGRVTCDPSVAIGNQVAAEGKVTGTPAESGTPLENLTKQLNSVKLRKQLSGAQRRKRKRLARQAGAIEGSVASLAPPQPDQVVMTPCVPSGVGGTSGADPTVEVGPQQVSTDSQGPSKVHQAAGGAPEVATPGGGSPEVHPNPKGKKRSRQVGGTPTSTKQPTKRSRPLSFKAAAEGSLQVAIVDCASAVGMTPDRAGTLQAKLCEALDQFPGGSLSPPRFMASGLSMGQYHLACSDQSTLDWLKTTVSSLGTLWEGADLQVRSKSELPKYLTFTAFFPGTVERKTMLDRLERQNPGLRTLLWRVYKQESRNGKTFFALGVDEPTAKILMERNCQLYYMLGRVTFMTHTKHV